MTDEQSTSTAPIVSVKVKVFTPRRLLLSLVVIVAAVLLVINLPYAPPDAPRKIRVAFNSAPDIDGIPSLLAIQHLREQGYDIEVTFYKRAELTVEALAQGNADIMSGATRAVWLAAGKGAPVVTVMEFVCDHWTLIAIPEITSCSDLGGKRYGVAGEAATSKALTDAYIKLRCPDAKPEIVTIAGSENRMIAFFAGEIDVTPVELSDLIEMERTMPGRFTTLLRFADEFPQLMTTGVHVNKNFAVQHPEFVRAYIRAVLQANRAVAENPTLAVDEARRSLDMEASLLSEIVDGYLANRIWDTNGGLTREKVQYSIDFYSAIGSLAPGLTTENVCNLSYLQSVLEEIGRR